MRRAVVFLLICCWAAPAAWAKSALDLMLEGRYAEAKAILDVTVASPRYQLIYFALTESEAARACSLYQVIAIRYPATDCDSVARIRLDQARETGAMIVPISEWANAAAGVKPLNMRHVGPAAPPPPAQIEIAPSVARAKPAAADTMVRQPVPLAQLDTTQVGKTEEVREKPVGQAVELTVPFSKIGKQDSSKLAPVDTTSKPSAQISVKIAKSDTLPMAKPEMKKETAVPTLANKPELTPKVPVKIAKSDTLPMAKPEVKKETPAPTLASKPEATAQIPVKVAKSDTLPMAKPEVKKETPPPLASKPDMTPQIPVKVAKSDTLPMAKPEVKKETPPPLASKPDMTPQIPVKIAKSDTLPMAKPEVKKETPVPPIASKPDVTAQIPAKIAKPDTLANTKPKVATPVVSTPKVVTPPSPPPTPSVAPAETLKAIKVEAPKAAGDTLAAPSNAKPAKTPVVAKDRPMASTGQWFIQVGAFANFDNAHRLATNLQKAGYPIKLVPRDLGTKKLLQVRVGGYKNRDDCVPVADELKSKYQVPTVIMTE